MKNGQKFYLTSPVPPENEGGTDLPIGTELTYIRPATNSEHFKKWHWLQVAENTPALFLHENEFSHKKPK